MESPRTAKHGSLHARAFIIIGLKAKAKAKAFKPQDAAEEEGFLLSSGPGFGLGSLILDLGLETGGPASHTPASIPAHSPGWLREAAPPGGCVLTPRSPTPAGRASGP